MVKMLKSYSIRTGRDYVKTTSQFKEIVSSAMMRLDIFYEDLMISHEKEVKSDSISSLVSDMGGQLGLWIGISITSILEVIFLLSWYLRDNTGR